MEENKQIKLQELEILSRIYTNISYSPVKTGSQVETDQNTLAIKILNVLSKELDEIRQTS